MRGIAYFRRTGSCDRKGRLARIMDPLPVPKMMSVSPSVNTLSGEDMDSD